MQKVTLISVGKVKTPWIAEGCAMYTERISHTCSFAHRVLSAGKPDEEHASIVKALQKTEGVIVALDERGKTMTSPTFAAWVGKQRDIGVPVTFVLGGAYGLNDEIRKMATLVLSLSSMTLPHELCQLFFLEQVYRAEEILRGSGYHH